MYLACGIYPRLQERKCEVQYWYESSSCELHHVLELVCTPRHTSAACLPDLHCLARRWNLVALAHAACHLHPLVTKPSTRRLLQQHELFACAELLSSEHR